MVLAVVAVINHHRNDHGGAFEGPCSYQPNSSIGPAAELTRTDYGPPVQVGYLVVQDRDADGLIVNANRVAVGLTVDHNESRHFLAPATSTTATCTLLNWG